MLVIRNAAGIEVSGDKNPNWRGGKIKKSCIVCKQEYFVKKCHSSSRFCSLKCTGIYQKGKKKNSTKEKAEIICNNCNVVFHVYPSQKHKYKFCSKFCRTKIRSKETKGDKNPNWQGGVSKLPYPYNFSEISKNILSYYNYKCQNKYCWGKDKRMTTHHIDYNKHNCNEENLIALCSSCNSRANFNKTMWESLYNAAKKANKQEF